ncbi:armadillo-like helical domain-containing protein, partial [Tanacetum coccineum]
METFQPLLNRTKLPQPSLQKQAVISIFTNLRSLTRPELDSDPVTTTITQCLTSNSPAVIDQTVREICLLVKESKLDVNRALLELQSGLEGCEARFVSLFVKALAFVVQLGFRSQDVAVRAWFESSEAHPFVKLGFRNEDVAVRARFESSEANLFVKIRITDQSVREVCLLVKECNLDFNRGLLLQSGLEGREERFVSLFIKALGFVVQLGAQLRFESSEVHPFVKLLQFVSVWQMFVIIYFWTVTDDVDVLMVPRLFLAERRPFSNFVVIQMSSSATMSLFARNLLSSVASLCCSFSEDSLPVFKMLTRCCKFIRCNSAELIHEAQLCGAELLETVFSMCTYINKYSSGEECIFDVSRRLIVVQSELGLRCIPEASTVMLSLFVTVNQSELEHIQLSILKLVLDLIKWKSGNETIIDVHEEILFVFPAISLMSSPSKYVKEAASELLIILGKLGASFLVAPTSELLMEERYPLNTSPTHRLRRKENPLQNWTSSIIEYCQRMVEIQKSSLPRSQSEETFLREIPPLLGAIASVLIVHPTLGNSAVDLLVIAGSMDPKLGVPLFLVVLFYHNILSRKSQEIDFQDIFAKTSKNAPLSCVTFCYDTTGSPNNHTDASEGYKSVLYATALRLLCKAWEINDRIFGSLQGLLLPEAFIQFKRERSICISMAVTIRDVCQKHPDRGVDIILSVEACIESTDAIIQALGVQSLALLCEADVIDFYTAWGVISKYVMSYTTDPAVANSICLLLRWGALDAESYPENATGVLQILWEVATSRHPYHGSSWANARESAFEALTCYEVPHFHQFIPDFREKNIEMLISETDSRVLEAMERFEVKILTHEHITRRRLVKEKRVPVNKIEKLLDAFPRVIGLSGNNSKARELPGAALFYL